MICISHKRVNGSDLLFSSIAIRIDRFKNNDNRYDLAQLTNYCYCSYFRDVSKPPNQVFKLWHHVAQLKPQIVEERCAIYANNFWPINDKMSQNIP